MTAEPRRFVDIWIKYRRHLLALVCSVGITLGIYLFRDQLVALESYGYVGVFLVSILGNATIVLPVPSIAIVFAGGGVLNPLLVGLVAGVGEPIGELTGYLAGYGGSAVIEDRDRFDRLQQWMQKNGFLTLLVLSAIPNPLFDLAGIAAGMLRYPVAKFLAAAWIGKSIKSIAVAYLGARAYTWIVDLF